ncbi:auxin efflux carrier [Hyaloraphidium curvatum]|nr:auxin efflux carrier [Hyaloraphidium curvatum]
MSAMDATDVLISVVLPLIGATLLPTPGELARVAWSAIGAVGGTWLIIGAGYVLAQMKWISPQTNKELSKVTLYLFSGCLMVFNLGDGMSPELFREAWPIPVFVAVFYLITWTLSFLGCFMLGVQEHRPWVTASIMFGNTNNWPVAIVYALVYERNKYLALPGKKETKTDILTRGLSYVFLYAFVSNLVRWSYGYNLLAKPPAGSSEPTSPRRVTLNVPEDDRSPPRRKSVGMGTDETPYAYQPDSAPSTPPRRPSHGAAGGEPSERTPLLSGAMVAEPTDMEGYVPEAGGDRGPAAAAPAAPRKSWFAEIAESRAYRVVAAILEPFSNPPMVASIAGVTIGLVAPLKGLIFGNDAPFKSLIGIPLRNCGEASVPLTLVGLGVTLRKTLAKQSQPHGLPAPGAPARPRRVGVAVAWICFVRLFLMCPIGIAAVYAARAWGVRLAQEDPLFVLVMLILGSSPTAVNLTQIAAVHGHYEDELSLTLLYVYGLTLPVQTLACTGYLVLVSDYLKFARPA